MTKQQTLSNLRGIVNMKYIAKETGIDNTNLHYIITGRKKSGFTEDEARKVGEVLRKIADMCNGCTEKKGGVL